jgi:hypothetical protein
MHECIQNKIRTTANKQHNIYIDENETYGLPYAFGSSVVHVPCLLQFVPSLHESLLWPTSHAWNHQQRTPWQRKAIVYLKTWLWTCTVDTIGPFGAISECSSCRRHARMPGSKAGDLLGRRMLQYIYSTHNWTRLVVGLDYWPSQKSKLIQTNFHTRNEGVGCFYLFRGKEMPEASKVVWCVMSSALWLALYSECVSRCFDHPDAAYEYVGAPRNLVVCLLQIVGLFETAVTSCFLFETALHTKWRIEFVCSAYYRIVAPPSQLIDYSCSTVASNVTHIEFVPSG